VSRVSSSDSDEDRSLACVQSLAWAWAFVRYLLGVDYVFFLEWPKTACTVTTKSRHNTTLRLGPYKILPIFYCNKGAGSRGENILRNIVGNRGGRGAGRGISHNNVQ